jgi:hypothetical protein
VHTYHLPNTSAAAWLRHNTLLDRIRGEMSPAAGYYTNPWVNQCYPLRIAPTGSRGVSVKLRTAPPLPIAACTSPYATTCAYSDVIINHRRQPALESDLPCCFISHAPGANLSVNVTAQHLSRRHKDVWFSSAGPQHAPLARYIQYSTAPHLIYSGFSSLCTSPMYRDWTLHVPEVISNCD